MSAAASSPIPPDVTQTAELIPDEFMERAAALRSAVIWQSNAANEVIARALMAERDAERERCISLSTGAVPDAVCDAALFMIDAALDRREAMRRLLLAQRDHNIQLAREEISRVGDKIAERAV